MVKLRRRTRLVQKAGARFRIQRGLAGFAQQLDRHGALQQRVLGMVNHTHPAAPQFGFDLITLIK